MTDTNTKPIAQPVREIIAECLGCDLDDVTDDQNFFDDLGGESIDLLDLSFRIEKDLAIRVNFHQLMSSEGWEFDEEGRLTAGSVGKLREEFPAIDVEQLGAAEGVPARALLTVGFIIEVVRSRDGAETPAAG